jgi:hypothetical protein
MLDFYIAVKTLLTRQHNRWESPMDYALATNIDRLFVKQETKAATQKMWGK